MLLITEIKTAWVPSDRHEIYIKPKYEYENLVASLNAPDYSQVETITTEMVEGRRFVRKWNGGKHEICLGISSEASEAIGFAMECFENQERELYDKIIESALYQSHWKEAIEMSFWNRLKFLFIGRRIKLK
jgi:hypothetical protein